MLFSLIDAAAVAAPALPEGPPMPKRGVHQPQQGRPTTGVAVEIHKLDIGERVGAIGAAAAQVFQHEAAAGEGQQVIAEGTAHQQRVAAQTAIEAVVLAVAAEAVGPGTTNGR